METEKPILLTPLKLGLRCIPPAVTLLYKDNASKRVRIMPVRFLDKNDNSDRIESITEELKSKHKVYLENVPKMRIKKMLRILQETQMGTDIEKASKIINNEYSVDPNQDLNKVSDVELAEKKEVMETIFLKNQIKAGDPEFQYDVQVEYNSKNKTDAGWDLTDEDDFWNE